MEEEGTMYERDSSICIKLYLKPERFAEIVRDAEAAGIRRKGLLLYTQKEHGLANEKLANTDKIAKYFKFTVKYYMDHEADRLREAAQAATELQAAKEKAARLGVKIE